jgi:hypothetical protein
VNGVPYNVVGSIEFPRHLLDGLDQRQRLRVAEEEAVCMCSAGGCGGTKGRVSCMQVIVRLLIV